MQRMLAYLATVVILAGLQGFAGSCKRQQPVPEQPLAEPVRDVAAPPEEEKAMRPTAVAGPPGRGFYVDDPDALRAQVKGYLSEAELPDLKGDVVAVMVPHAGYEYSGPVAAYSYKVLQDKPVSTVILIGNSHNMRLSGAALSPHDTWETPLGAVEVDRGITQQLADLGPPFYEDPVPHAPEHSLEVQLPFLKVVLPDAKIVPILISSMPKTDCRRLGHALASVLKRPDVVIAASSDMAHYPVYEEATRCDRTMLDAVVTMEPDRILETDQKLMRQGVSELHCTLCAIDSVIATIVAAKEVGASQATVLKYANSGDTAGMRGRCVGYGAVAFTAPAGARGQIGSQADEEAPTTDTVKLTDEEKRRLLEVARRTLEAHLGSGEAPSLDPGDSGALARKTACFVTLKEQGRLRGCIDELEPRDPLIQAVASRAIAAATQDPRFLAVAADELPKIAIEISAMSPLRKVSSPDEVVVGKHGVVVREGMRSGVFLPQVAPEQGWDRDTMLTVLCTEKAGLPPDAWQKGAELQVFTANVFSEEEFGLAPAGSLKTQ